MSTTETDGDSKPTSGAVTEALKLSTPEPRQVPVNNRGDAKTAIEQFVNSCNCRTRADAERALADLVAMATAALDLVRHGKMEKLS